MQHVYEFELFKGECQWCAVPFDLPGATQGADVSEASESAADLLREIVLDSLVSHVPLPKPTFGNKLQHEGTRLVVSVEASLANVPKLSAAQAADLLGVTRSRVSAMISSRLLDGWRDGRNTWVTRASVEARLADPRPAGRPKSCRSHEELAAHA